MSDTRTPIFDIADHLPTTVSVGDDALPILVAFLDQADLLAFKKGFTDLFKERGAGTPALTDEELEARGVARAHFAEEWITKVISLEEGVLRVHGAWVTTGEGFVNVFGRRQDVVLSTLVRIYDVNHLSTVIRKNSNSPLVSASGSAPTGQTVPASGGETQGPTAAGAASSSTAETAPVADSLASPGASPSSSGSIPAPAAPTAA